MKRPYKTLYYDKDTGGDIATQGHSASEKGAIRGSVVRVFTEQHRRAEIHEGEVLIYTVRHTKEGIRVRYGST